MVSAILAERIHGWWTLWQEHVEPRTLALWRGNRGGGEITSGLSANRKLSTNGLGGDQRRSPRSRLLARCGPKSLQSDAHFPGFGQTCKEFRATSGIRRRVLPRCGSGLASRLRMSAEPTIVTLRLRQLHARKGSLGWVCLTGTNSSEPVLLSA